MFVLSFKASSIKIIGAICVCVLVAIAVITLLPESGSGLNVNKFDFSKQLSEINVKNEDGRAEYLATLGYGVTGEPVSTSSEKLPKEFDEVMSKYNYLQRTQGFDLERYSGKKITGYTYEVSSFPDNTKMGDDTYYATILVYKNKVVGADLCCPERNEYTALVKML